MKTKNKITLRMIGYTSVFLCDCVGIYLLIMYASWEFFWVLTTLIAGIICFKPR